MSRRNKNEMETCVRCKEDFPLFQLEETINLRDRVEYFCKPCLEEVDNEYQKEKRKRGW